MTAPPIVRSSRGATSSDEGAEQEKNNFLLQIYLAEGSGTPAAPERAPPQVRGEGGEKEKWTRCQESARSCGEVPSPRRGLRQAAEHERRWRSSGEMTAPPTPRSSQCTSSRWIGRSGELLKSLSQGVAKAFDGETGGCGAAAPRNRAGTSQRWAPRRWAPRRLTIRPTRFFLLS